jgi:ribosome biogenesis GTPase / thiamine phosphate phosphatase
LIDYPSESLEAIGFDDARRAELTSLGAHLHPARVTRVDRGAATVRTEHGELRVAIPLGGDVAVGDFVALSDDGVLDRVLERRGSVTRLVGNTHETLQVVAANVDLLLVVRPLDLSSSPARIQSLVNLSYEAGATPVVLLTKSDLVEDVAPFVDEVLSAVPGADVLAVSVVTGEGLEDLRRLVAGRTVLFIGESGGGKSTLTNFLVGRDALATGETKADGQGRHTTSHRELVALPEGGAIIDTPGVRDVVSALTAAQVSSGYSDVTELAEQCRFADCAHTNEPGCAVVVALASGQLADARFEAYKAALKDVAWAERRENKRVQAEQRRSYRTLERQRRRDSW